MKLFTKLKRRFKPKRKTRSVSFNDYKRSRSSRRRPLKKRKGPKASPSRLQKKKQVTRIKMLNIIKLLVVLSVLIGAIYMVFFTKLFEVQNIDVTGEDGTFDEQTAVQLYLDDYLGKNLLFFETIVHNEALNEQFPHLKNIRIHREFFHTVSAHIEKYENLANVELTLEDGSKQFYILNEEGYISVIGTIQEGLPNISMDLTSTDATLYEDSETPPNEIIFIPKDTLEKLIQAKEDFEGKFNMQIIDLEYLKSAREIHLTTERNFTIWIDLTKDINEQLSKLKKALNELNIYEANIDYIDLRISGQNGEKVIYKLIE